MAELLPTDEQGYGFSYFHQRKENKVLACEMCRRPIVTKIRNEWAAHWSCVVPRESKHVDVPARHTLDCDMVKHPNCTRCSCGEGRSHEP